jgi:K+-transporting ATPase c subunit
MGRKHMGRKHMNHDENNISGGVFLIGLALLFMTGWWWPGIMFVIGASIIAGTIAEGKDWREANGAFWVIGIGVVFGMPAIFGWINWGMIFPLILIGLGLYLLFGQKDGKPLSPTRKRKNEEHGDFYDDDYDVV